MLETYYAGVSWGARRETAAECARRLEEFFKSLAACEPSFEHWYQPGPAPRGQPGRPLQTDDARELEAFLLQGAPPADSGHPKATRLTLLCGCYAPYPSNSCVLALPAEGAACERLLRASLLAQVLTRMATAWDAE